MKKCMRIWRQNKSCDLLTEAFEGQLVKPSSERVRKGSKQALTRTNRQTDGLLNGGLVGSFFSEKERKNLLFPSADRQAGMADCCWAALRSTTSGLLATTDTSHNNNNSIVLNALSSHRAH